MPRSKSVQSSGVSFSYWEHGPAEGTPVLLLHGFPYAANAWDEVVARLQPNKRKLRLLVLSMRGYGETRVLEENLLTGQEAALAHDVLVFADALKLQRFLMIGHDWGARAAYDVSVLAPERVMGVLALSSPYVLYGGGEMPPKQVQSYWYQWFFQTAQGEKMLRNEAKELCEHIWHAWSPRWKFSKGLFEATAAYWKNPQFATIVLGSYRQRHGNELGKPAYTAEQDLLDTRPEHTIRVPTLFGYGTDDHCDLPEATEDQRKYFSGWYERVAIKGSGHFPPRENPGAVVRLFDQLLKKVK